jgi:glutamate dehydrogenase
MASKKEIMRDELLEKITALIKKKLPEDETKLVSQFIRRYYATVALDELLSRNITDLYGAVLSHWSLTAHHKPDEIKIHIYNPQFELHGWQSTHTVIEVVSKDMPFIVDSILMELNRRGLNTHVIFHMGSFQVKRDKQGRIIEILPAGSTDKDAISEAVVYFEIDRQPESSFNDIKKGLESVLMDVTHCVTDWPLMMERVKSAIEELKKNPPPVPPCNKDNIEESTVFLNWLLNDHFTFLGYREYVVAEEDGQKVLKNIPNSGLGVLKDDGKSHVSRLYANLSKRAMNVLMSPEVLLVTKTNTRSTVHRPVYTDMISIKQFDSQGVVIGEKRMIGLFTSVAYNSSPSHIPLLRQKVQKVIEGSNLSPKGHAGKALVNILETLPRDDLFQSGTTAENLLDLCMDILHLQERRRIRFFFQEDVFRRYVSCIVFVPRDCYNTELRVKIQSILMTAFAGTEVEFVTLFTESTLARLYFTIRLDSDNLQEVNLQDIELLLQEAGRSWEDGLKDFLVDSYGEELGNAYIQKYLSAFPAGYRETFASNRSAISDIAHFEKLKTDDNLEMSLFRAIDEPDNVLRFKLFRLNKPVPLSDALPILENMGLRVVSEQPHRLKFKNKETAWLHDFSMHIEGLADLDIDAIKEKFQETVASVWYGWNENDSFNKLSLLANLSWREITVIRAYAKYFRQINFNFSQSYIEETVCNYPNIVNKLVELFLVRFAPSAHSESERQSKVDFLNKEILAQLDTITNLDQDRILRQYFEIIQATIRTNYFQTDKEGMVKSYISFKFDPTKVPYLPLPAPMFEIYVYSPRVEGVHLRSGSVARGGLRWSDRKEDYRTEVLGLMKAQRVKNSVIVPYGAKGGFIPKQLPVTKNRDEILQEAISSYQIFISGLLDLTDNLVGGAVIPPENTVRYDSDDPYLVVAADKGTATFSDYANSVSLDYGFWLGDAFASGGKTGYDHKKMGITAKGAWESVKRHFRELGFDTQKDPFTVVGIGDLAGDVFGNGMLLSDKIRLVAAFNHQHIFVDPDPDPAISFKERTRLFNLPRSTWEDYNPSLISQGGGVFNRLVKSIKLSPEIKEVLDTTKDYMEPNELIRSFLKAPVDLLWNGGIGTFVKASNERHEDVGDRANDAIRINGNELRCSVVGEGGNLGFTQLGRIEYALNDGKIYTDFIDNSAGVDCSDHEVNIKILLNGIVANGDLTEKQRNELLASMTMEVGELVLPDNYAQTQTISIVNQQTVHGLDDYVRLINVMEASGGLVRDIEFLPSDQTLYERKSMGKGLTTPEIAVLLSYTKIALKEAILGTDLPEDPYISDVIFEYFPTELSKRYKKQIKDHSLHREIVAMQMSNHFVNKMGLVCMNRLQEQTGATVRSILRAYVIARDLFGYSTVIRKVEQLDLLVPTHIQTEMLSNFARFMRRVTGWFLYHHHNLNDIKSIIQQYEQGLKQVIKIIPALLLGTAKESYDKAMEYYIGYGVPEDLSNLVALSGILFSVLDIISAASEYKFELEKVATVYATLADRLEFTWVKGRINDHLETNHWDSLAKAAYREDLEVCHRQLTIGVLRMASQEEDAIVCIDRWIEHHAAQVERWQRMVTEIRSSGNSVDYVMFAMSIRELQVLAREIDLQDYNDDVEKKRAAQSA